jgi:secondary thiamine-phosphate synthase enzyme
MPAALKLAERPRPHLAKRAGTGFQVWHEAIQLQTREGLQFIDLTQEISEIVAASGIANGIVNVQTRHTTTAVIVNEHEPLLLEDLKETLERLAPQQAYYRHNDFEIRTANMTPDESPNGHSHCRSLLLSSSATLNIIDGELQLGRWQSIFFIELDHARQRTVAVTVMGQATELDWAA